MDVMNPSSLAGGGKKGGGKYKGGGGRASGTGNPLGADGRKMKCHECDSDQHLVRECPQRR
eukprot:6602347-Heterocapsa_arctica.AAC.1